MKYSLFSVLDSPRALFRALRLLLITLCICRGMILRAADDSPAATVNIEYKTLLMAMRNVEGYDPGKIANAVRFKADVLQQLYAGLLNSQFEEQLRIPHQLWYRAFLETTRIPVEEPPVFLQQAHDVGQDMFIKWDFAPQASQQTSASTRIAEVTAAWSTEGKRSEYSYVDHSSEPPLLIIYERQVTFALYRVGENIAILSDIKGLRGRPDSGFAGAVLKLAGAARIVRCKIATAEDNTAIFELHTRKGPFRFKKILTVSPDGKVQAGIPAHELSLLELKKKLEDLH